MGMEVCDMPAHVRPVSTNGQKTESCSVSVIVPTRNEAHNVKELTRRLVESMPLLGSRWELIFVDDSDDETPDRICSLIHDTSVVRLIHRLPGERQGGLAGAVVEGFGAAQGSTIVVMDGDLQHPPEAVPVLAVPVLSGACSIAVGSRYVKSAHADGLAGPYRRSVSQGSRVVVRSLFPALWQVHDPLSGFFALQKSVVANSILAPKGFKILLEVLIRGHWDEVREIPYEFAARKNGGSKAGWHEGAQLLQQLVRLRLPSAAALTGPSVQGEGSSSARRTLPDGVTVLSVVGDVSPS
jgi:dolichol-phosphate mannosyltransferase